MASEFDKVMKGIKSQRGPSKKELEAEKKRKAEGKKLFDKSMKKLGSDRYKRRAGDDVTDTGMFD